jgi:3-deoxy-7-phosphoheptulonate synthase
VSAWTPESWQAKTVAQSVRYPDPAALARVLAEMRQLPPLVTSWEVEALRNQLAAAARGEAFLLQGGDCAESFDDCRSESISAKLKILMQMSLVLVHGTRLPVVRVGRIAGQYAKPRSADLETKDGVSLPSYRGDSVNREPFTEEDRTPDPLLLLRGYERAALTLNFVRALADGGFADLHHPEYWDISFAHGARHVDEYHRIVDQIREGISFVTAVTGIDATPLKRVDFYTSHEALALPYDAAQTRTVPRRPGWYNLSTHMPWIGMRTAAVDGGHVEYHRGIENPLGIKIGPAMTREWLTELLDACSTPRTSPAGSRSSTAWARARSRPICRRWSRRCAPPAAPSCGCATRCTATPRPRRRA